MSYKREFPHQFHDMPQTLTDMRLMDNSWHNDACPSFVVIPDPQDESNPLVRLWVDAKDPNDREFPRTPRFSLQTKECVLMISEDWEVMYPIVKAIRDNFLASIVDQSKHNT